MERSFSPSWELTWSHRRQSPITEFMKNKTRPEMRKTYACFLLICLRFFIPISTLVHQTKDSNLFHWRSKADHLYSNKIKLEGCRDNVRLVHSLALQEIYSFRCGLREFFLTFNLNISCTSFPMVLYSSSYVLPY